MKLSRRIKIKVSRGVGKLRWMPSGYYTNRPSLLRRFCDGGLGRIESVRFIQSPSSSHIALEAVR